MALSLGCVSLLGGGCFFRLSMVTAHSIGVNFRKWFFSHQNNYLISYVDLHDVDLTSEELNSRVTDDILKAAEHSIPKLKQKNGQTLLRILVNLIKQKRAILKNLKFSSNTNLRIAYNKLSSDIRLKMMIHKEKIWTEFLDKHGSHPVSARPFWNETNKTKE